MKFKSLIWPQALALAASLAGGAACAQATHAPVTDVAPPPAEERDSAGAVVLDKSLQQARRSNAFADSAARTGVGSVGQGVMRSAVRERTRSDLASARQGEAAELYRRGTGSLTAR